MIENFEFTPGQELYVNKKWYFDVKEVESDKIKVRIKYNETKNSNLPPQFKTITIPKSIITPQSKTDRVVYCKLNEREFMKLVKGLVDRIAVEPDVYSFVTENNVNSSIFYHGTLSENLDSIKKDGLLLNSKSNQQIHGFNTTGKLYVSSDYNEAFYYCSLFANKKPITILVLNLDNFMLEPWFTESESIVRSNIDVQHIKGAYLQNNLIPLNNLNPSLNYINYDLLKNRDKEVALKNHINEDMGAVSNPGLSGTPGLPGSAGSGDISTTGSLPASVWPKGTYGLEDLSRGVKKLRKMVKKSNHNKETYKNKKPVKIPLINVLKENNNDSIDKDYQTILYTFLDYPYNNDTDILMIEEINKTREEFLNISPERIQAFFNDFYKFNKSLIERQCSDKFKEELAKLRINTNSENTVLESVKKKVYENVINRADTTIRPATKEEIRKFVSDMEEMNLPPSEQILLNTISHTSNVHGAFEGDLMMGAFKFAADKDVPNTTEIEVMLINPTFRKMGVGKMIVDYVCDNSITDQILVHPHTANVEAFYKKIGFVADENIDPNDPNSMILTIVELLDIKLLSNDKLNESHSILSEEDLYKLGQEYAEKFPYVDHGDPDEEGGQCLDISMNFKYVFLNDSNLKNDFKIIAGSPYKYEGIQYHVALLYTPTNMILDLTYAQFEPGIHIKVYSKEEFLSKYDQEDYKDVFDSKYQII